MATLLRFILIALLTNLIARVLLGAGLAVVAYVFVIDLVRDALDFGAAQFGALPAAALQMALLMGVGEALTIVGTALLARAAIISASTAIGLNQST